MKMETAALLNGNDGKGMEVNASVTRVETLLVLARQVFRRKVE